MRLQPEVHRHLEPEASPRDRGFLRTFVAAAVILVAGAAALVWVTDPLATFGTGLLPPAVTADRDYKAVLFRNVRPRPAIVVLGSSRVKTLDPACISRITGKPAFNFGVNGAAAEDMLAVSRYLRSDPRDSVREILLGLDVDLFQDVSGTHRPLELSRALSQFVDDAERPTRFVTLGADLFGWQSVSAAWRSLWIAIAGRSELPGTELLPNGLQVYPRDDDAVRRGTFDATGQVYGSINGVRSRYDSFVRLSARRLALLDRLLDESAKAGIAITVFIPPAHPALDRALAGTAAPGLTAELVSRLDSDAARGRLRYVETRTLADIGGDSTAFYDAIHMMPANASRLLGRVLGVRDGCALQ